MIEETKKSNLLASLKDDMLILAGQLREVAEEFEEASKVIDKNPMSVSMDVIEKFLALLRKARVTQLIAKANAVSPR